MRIYADGVEMGEVGDEFWKTSFEPKGKMPVPCHMHSSNQDRVSITIERGNVNIESDINHTLFYNRSMAREFWIDFLVRCEYCRHITPASNLCEYCGAPLL